MSNATFAEIAEALGQAQSLVVCGHVSPDGDCLGSQLALTAALRAMGKQVTSLLALDEELDYGLRFLPGANEMVPAAQFDGEFDTFVTVDVPNAKRMGDAAQAMHARAQRTVTIDHHLSEAPLSQINYVDPDAPATASIVWELIGVLGVEPDAAMATCCYTGVITDTGRFQYQNTTAELLRTAADIVAHGADPAHIAREIYQNRSKPSLSLELRMLSRMEVTGNGSFVISYLLRSDFVETGATKADAEPLIDTLRSLRGIRVACLLRQQGDAVRGSVRAKDATDVAEVARHLGGGGHTAAAGFTFEGTIDEARAAVQHEFEAL